MTVNNVNNLLTFVRSQTDISASQTDEAVQGCFGQVMSQLNGGAGSSQKEVSDGNFQAAQNIVPVKKETVSVKTEQTNISAKDAVRKETDGNVADSTGADMRDAAAEEVEKTGEALVKEIADEMDVTPEEVEEAMALLGLTAVQLLDPDNLKQLLLTVSGNTDELALLTDESLYGSLQELLGVLDESLKNLQEELGISEEELNALLEQMSSEEGKAGLPDEAQTPEMNLEGMKDYTVSVQKDGETVQMKVTVDDASGDKSVQESVTGTAKPEVQGNHKMQQENSGDNGKEGGASGQSLLQMPETQAEIPEISDTAANVEYRSLQTEEIMNQIVEYMKINLKADTQSMELQLHPASLGTVNVQIMARESGLTAHFTTQNEAVRAVIETQLIQLKNQFEEQGIKVDAVEVTVANHAYGQQFSQDNGNEGQEQSKAGKGRRRINLNQMEGEETAEELEESDRIAVEMMQANGNTVDYTV